MSNSKWRHLFTNEEWVWAHKTSQAIHDPKEKKEFWENLLEVKQSQEEPISEKAKIARHYCSQILAKLKGHRPE